MTKKRHSREYNAIRKNLLEQLQRRGALTPVFVNLVNDYMALYDLQQLLIADIEEHGIRIPYDNGGGQNGEKDNPSIQQRVRVNAQMLKILSQLNITTDNVQDGEEDEL